MHSKKLHRVMLVVYLLLLTALVFLLCQGKLGLAGLDTVKAHTINLIPFAQSLFGEGGTEIKAILIRVVSFVPLGLYLPLLRGKKHPLRHLLPILALSLCYQGLEYALSLRGIDITDLISNTLGGGAGIGIAYGLAKKYGKKAKKILSKAAVWATVAVAVLLVAGLVLYFK
jgi:glycopeptide antibiotics resistance protein